jgi:cytochrome P450
MLGNGIFNRGGETWKGHRALARPFFARERIADFETFEKHTAKTISLIDAHSKTGTAFDAQDLFGRFTLDTGSEFVSMIPSVMTRTTLNPSLYSNSYSTRTYQHSPFPSPLQVPPLSAPKAPQSPENSVHSQQPLSSVNRSCSNAVEWILYGL